MGLFHHDCDECKPGGRHQSYFSIFVSTIPFTLSFLIFFVIISHRLKSQGTSTAVKPHDRARSLLRNLAGISRRQWLVSISSFTLALSTILVEVILCEILGLFSSGARKAVFQITIWLLLVLLILVIPFLEIRSGISGNLNDLSRATSSRPRLRLIFELVALALWLVAFWWCGEALLGEQVPTKTLNPRFDLAKASLERIGILGISLMALLSGFASISAPWQTFFVRLPHVRESDLARKEAGLTATNDMLAAKQSRHRALERKLLDRPKETSFFSKAVSSFRPPAEQAELKSLEMEISGLETMASALHSTYDQLKTQWRQQEMAGTATGRLYSSATYSFALFCIYRVFTMTFTFFRRVINSPIPQSDPINSLLSLLAKHYDPSINQETWSRALTFLFSGIILLASFSSVRQTFNLTSRYVPALLQAVQSNLPLVAAQLSGTYVLSAVLMLRGLMPKDLLGDSFSGIGGGTQQWVDRWFEACFLVGVAVTSLGIWIGRKLKDDDDYWETDVEGGKRS